MYNSLFWKDLLERVVATVAQVLLAILTADGFDVATFDLNTTVTLVGVAALGVVLKSLVAGQVHKTVSPASLAKDERGV